MFKTVKIQKKSCTRRNTKVEAKRIKTLFFCICHEIFVCLKRPYAVPLCICAIRRGYTYDDYRTGYGERRDNIVSKNEDGIFGNRQPAPMVYKLWAFILWTNCQSQDGNKIGTSHDIAGVQTSRVWWTFKLLIWELSWNWELWYDNIFQGYNIDILVYIWHDLLIGFLYFSWTIV